MTNALLLLNTEETYRNLQPFCTIEDLNNNTIAIREQFADQMTRSTYDVLDVLHRWACKFPGVCFLSKSKIATLLGISRRTVIRACNTLEDLGVIAQHETKRQGGDRRQSSNAIVFVKVDVTPNVTPECHTVNTPANAPENTNTVNTYDTDAPVIHSEKKAVKENEKKCEFNPTDKSHLEASLPDGWYTQASGYAKDYNDLYAITGALFKAKHGTDLRVEEHVAEFGEVLRKAWVAFKNGRIAQSKWYAYLFAAFKRAAHAIVRRARIAPIHSRIAERMGFVV